MTVYVFHEPSLLSSLQDNGLTAVMLKALVVKEVGYIVLHYLQVHFSRALGKRTNKALINLIMA